MATTTKDLKIRYTGDTTGVQNSLKQLDTLHASLGSKLNSLGKSFSNAGKSMTLGLTLPLVGFGVVAAKEFADSEHASAQTAAAIKSTGAAANVTVSQVEAMSKSLGDLSAQEDETVQGAANMLLTFTNVRNEIGKGNDIFNQSVAASADMAAALGTDVKGAAMQLGKALNDPVAGMTRLTRSGVTFTKQQTHQVAVMQKAGDTVGAQKVILAELNKEFGGSAKAAGKTAGPLVKLQLTFKDLAEQVGKYVVPLLDKLAGWLKIVADWFSNLSPKSQKLAVTIGAIVAAAGPLLFIFGKFTSIVGTVISGVGAIIGAFTGQAVAEGAAATGAVALDAAMLPLIATIGIVILVVAAIAAAAYLVIKNWSKVKAFLGPLFDSIATAAKVAWTAVTKAVGAAFAWILSTAKAVWKAIGSTVITAAKVIFAIAKTYVTVWIAAIKVVWQIAVTAWKVIIGAVKIAWAIIKPIAKAYIEAFKLAFKIISTAAKIAWKVITTVVKAAWAILRPIAHGIKALFTATWKAIVVVAKIAWKAVTTVVKAEWDALKAIGHGILGFFRGIWQGIKSAASTAWHGVSAVVTGVWDTIVNAAHAAFNGIANLWNNTVGKLSFHVPSWVPLIGGSGFDVPDIPLMAAGGRIVGAGLAIVGDRGPELLSMPVGAQVAPLGQPIRATGMGGERITITLDRRRFGRGLELETLTRGR